MNLSDWEYLAQNLNTSDLMGSDSCLGNIFLLQPKYNTELFINNNIFYRKYLGQNNRYGYGFPLLLKSSLQEDKFSYLKDAFSFILQKNSSISDIFFCLFTQEQKNALDECLLKNFPNYKIAWNTIRDDCDYIYLQEKLSSLSGSILQKKKNHISQFYRFFEGRWSFKTFPENNIIEDILEVENKWYNERSNDVEKAFDNESLSLEKESIQIALQNAELFNIHGAVLYIDEKPCAMTLASPISNNCLDIHFEKALSEVASKGAYAVINNLFVKTCTDFKYINREEDMGVEGLRHAKLSYKPEILLDKFFGQVVKC